MAQGQKKCHVFFHVPGDEEVVFHMLSAVLAQLLGIFEVAQKQPYSIGCALDAM